MCALVAGSIAPPIRNAFLRRGHRLLDTPLDTAVSAVVEEVEAVLLVGARRAVMPVATRLKTRFQVPLLPVVAVVPTPARASTTRVGAPDAWLLDSTRPAEVVTRVEELVRIRRAERELVRLSGALAELAAENGRLYDRARRDAEATTTLLRELQHRVRNNLAAIQALLVLERHRSPPRPLSEAIDVAISRLRSMAAMQDSLAPNEGSVRLATLAGAVTRGALDVFGRSGSVRYAVTGDANVPARAGSALAIVLNELITNALKHASCTHVQVGIERDGRDLAVVVADDGCGVDDSANGGSGLMIVRAVVRNELNGSLTFLPGDQGTRVRVGFAMEDES